MLNVGLGVLAAIAALPVLLFGFVWSSAGSFRFAGEAFLAAILLSLSLSVWRLRRRAKVELSPVSWTLRFRRAMVSLFLAALAGCFVSIATYGASARPPRQATVVARLSEHRATLDVLRTMMIEDRLTFVREPSFVTPVSAEGVTAERASEYGRLLEKADIRLVRVRPDGAFEFVIASWGTQHGWSVSLAWSEKAPTPLVPDIDAFAPSREGGVRYAYSQIEGPWYAFIDWWGR